MSKDSEHELEIIIKAKELIKPISKAVLNQYHVMEDMILVIRELSNNIDRLNINLENK